MKRINDLFRKRQYMIQSDYELYLYSDPANLKVCPHTHNFYEIFFLRSEQIEFVIGNQVYQVKRGDFLLLPPGLLHYPSRLETAPGQTYDRIVLWCSLPCFEEFADYDPDMNDMWDAARKNASYHVRPSAVASKQLEALFLRLMDEQGRISHAHKSMIHFRLGEIFAQINQIIFEAEHFEQHSPSAALFNNILYYIHTHLTEDLSLDVLALNFFVSKGYISKIFRDHLNVSVYQYIQALRLEGVRNAMIQGASIAKAAETFGFGDYSCFFRAFKKMFHVSPKEYQQGLADEAEVKGDA